MLREARGISKLVLRAGKTDLRYGIRKLASMLIFDYGFDPEKDGGLYLFSGSKRDTVKALTYDNDGFLLMTKQLASGSFLWPKDTDDALEISRESYERLMDGYRIDSFLSRYEALKL